MPREPVMAKDYSQVVRPKTLYHATIHDVGDFIEPKENYTVTREQRGQYVFAGDDLTAAYAYSIKTDGCISSGMLYKNNQKVGHYVLFNNRDNFYKIDPTGTIWALDPKTFSPVFSTDGRMTEEWVATDKIAVRPEQAIHTNGIVDTMRHSVQVFFLTRQPTQAEIATLNSTTSIEDYAALIKSGLLHWENQHRNIKPSSSMTLAIKALGGASPPPPRA